MRSVVVVFLGVCALACTPTAPAPGSDAGPRPDAAVPDPTVVALPDVGQAPTLPPASGGALLATSGGRLVASDADRATIWVLDPEAPGLVGHVALGPGELPGQAVEDGDGLVHVVLRDAGALLTLDPADATTRERRSVCPAPRGLAWDPARDLIWVACLGGELVGLPPSGGAARQLWLDDDLRDVVIADGALHVTRFRSAELLTVDPEAGTVVTRRQPSTAARAGRGPTVTRANTAWRARAAASGGVIVLHQSAQVAEVRHANGYGNGDPCGGVAVVNASLSYFPPDGAMPYTAAAVRFSPLSVDFVERRDGALALARAVTDALGPGAPTGVMHVPARWHHASCLGDDRAVLDRLGPATGVARLPGDRLAVFYRDPLRVVVGDDLVFEGAPLARDRGYEIFHSNTPSQMACASCHPEGGEDGHTFLFAEVGFRRTQSLLGGVLETAPFHWSGDQADMTAIMDGGFVDRMGARLADSATDVAATEAWIDAQPLPARSIRDPAAVERGRAGFEASGCAGCHAGAAYSSNESVVLGAAAGEPFQVPALRGVGQRAPYFHDGCAATLDAVLDGSCRPEHPAVVDRADLVAFLESL